MPINRIISTKRAKAAIAALGIGIGAITGATYLGAQVPASVELATNSLIKPWEALRLVAYRDSVGIPTICWGETQGVHMGMKKTRAECDAMLNERVLNDYYTPLTKCIANFTTLPVSLQAAQISGAYNFGVSAMCRSRAARLAADGKYREACEAQTAFNKAGGEVLTGLVRRREMGDAQRIGEAELCVSGL